MMMMMMMKIDDDDDDDDDYDIFKKSKPKGVPEIVVFHLWSKTTWGSFFIKVSAWRFATLL